MRRLAVVLALTALLISSCSLFVKQHTADSLYILDWMNEAVYTMDKEFNAGTSPLCATGTAPSAIKADGDGIFISNSGFGGQPSVMKYNEEGNLTATYNAPENSSPSGIDIDSRYVYVGLWGSGSIAVLDKDSLALVRMITGIRSPWDILVNDNKIYAGTSDWAGFNYLYIIDTGDWTVDSVEAGLNPTYLSLYNDRVYVSCTGNSFEGINGSIAVIENSERMMSAALQSSPANILAAEDCILAANGYTDNDDAYISNVLVIDRHDLSIIDTLNLNQVSCFAPLDNKIIAGSNAGKIYVIDLETLTETDLFTLSQGIYAADMSSY